MKIVMAVNDWPEDDQNDFKVFNVLDAETEEEAIERAKKAYNHEMKFYIIEY